MSGPVSGPVRLRMRSVNGPVSGPVSEPVNGSRLSDSGEKVSVVVREASL